MDKVPRDRGKTVKNKANDLEDCMVSDGSAGRARDEELTALASFTMKIMVVAPPE